MKKWMMLTAGTCLIALALTALPSAVAETSAPVVGEVLFPAVLDTPAAPTCELGEAMPWLQSMPWSQALLPGAGYQCPTGVPYCWRAQDCGNYCSGGQAVCEFGCCACAS